MPETEPSQASRSPWKTERTRQADLEERAVEVDDPQLSPALNHELTLELREAVGADRVSVPKDRPRPSHGEMVHHAGFMATLSSNRYVLLVTFFFALTFGAIVSLRTNSWWILAAAVGVHALGTMTITGFVLRITSTIEHPAATVLAAMEEAGVANPDERFSDMVAEFAPADEYAAPDAEATVSPGGNRRTAAAGDNPAAASAQQAHSMTPSSGPSEPVSGGGVVPALPWVVPAGLAVFSVLIPLLAGGGAMWLTAAIVLPCVAGYYVMQAALKRGARVRVPLVVAGTVTAVVIAGVIIAALQL